MEAHEHLCIERAQHIKEKGNSFRYFCQVKSIGSYDNKNSLENPRGLSKEIESLFPGLTLTSFLTSSSPVTFVSV